MKNLRRILEYYRANWDWLSISRDQHPDNLYAELVFHKKLLCLFQENDFFYVVLNQTQHVIEYCSQDVTKLLGYTPNEFTLDFFNSKIHPDDIENYMKFDAEASSFLKLLPPEKVTKYKARFNFRLKRKNGRYACLLEQVWAIGYEVNGADFHLLVLFTDITHLKGTTGLNFNIIGMDGEPTYFQPSETESSANCALLSKREKEILSLLAQNRTSEEIAAELCISRHTVDNHRRNMLHKTESTSTLQLVMRSFEGGWI